MKKQTRAARISALLLLAVLLASVPAFALDVPQGQTEVRIPVAIDITGPVAGAEIGFTHTANGLTFTGLELSADLSGTLTASATQDGVTGVGFFSDANKYGSDGKIDVGYLVFTYTGDAENTVTLVDCTVYTVDASGKSVRDVRDTSASEAVSIKRVADTGETPGNPDAPGAGDTPGTSGTSSGGSGSTRANDGFVVGIDEDETPLATAGASFSDLTQAEWAREAIEYMAANKGILGMGDGLFAPNAEVTRAQFARFTAQALDIEKGTEAASFTDVAESAWYHADVTTLASAGILTGYGDGRFGPEDTISREQMAAIIDRALTAKGVALPEIRVYDLTDADAASAYAKASIEKLYAAGVINGMGDGSFAPKATATRAQSCVILHNALKAAGLL